MKANELRIGNLVDWDEKTIRSKVKGIHPSGNYLHLDNGWVQLSRCEPILLTEEWLVRFGFEKLTKGGSIYKLKDFHVQDFSPLGIYECNNHIEIKYVHQLQNLYFALTGEELKDNLVN